MSDKVTPELVEKAIRDKLEELDADPPYHVKELTQAALDATPLVKMREALEEARRYIANCWIDPVAADEEKALVAKIDAALSSNLEGG